MGQHISFYTKDALQTLADQAGLNFYTDGRTLHLFTAKKLPADPFRWEYRLSHRIFNRLYQLLKTLDPRRNKLEGRLESDYKWLAENLAP